MLEYELDQSARYMVSINLMAWFVKEIDCSTLSFFSIESILTLILYTKLFCDFTFLQVAKRIIIINDCFLKINFFDFLILFLLKDIFQYNFLLY